MVFRVNKNLPPNERIPYSLTFRQRDRLATEYKSQYPRSIVYQLTLLCAVTLIALAAVFAGIRIWEAADQFFTAHLINALLEQVEWRARQMPGNAA